MTVTGFILEPTYRIERGRAVVHLWGVLASGASFLVRDRRAAPTLHARTADAARVCALGGPEPAATALRSMAGEVLSEVTCPTPADAATLRDRLEDAGLRTYEADVRFAMRYLMDRGIRGGVAIDGEGVPGQHVAHVFDEPALSPAPCAPTLRVLSLDIETLPDASRILSFALHGPDVAEVTVVESGSGTAPAEATLVPDERSLLTRLARRLRAIDPDVLTGWNVVGFDLAVIERRARDLGVPLVLGRGSGLLRVTPSRPPWATARAQVDGRVVLDGIDLLRGAFMRMDSYRLDAVARSVLGEGKTISKPGRPEEIERLWREDLVAFCAYNLKDAELVSRILETTGLVRLAVSRSLLTGMPLDRVSASIASFDALYLPAMRARSVVAPTLRRMEAATDGEPHEATSGGAVLSPVPGLHERVLVFDFKSLYPSLMRTFNIDPLTHVRDPEPGCDLIRTPSGACFDREPGILPALLATLMDVRADAKRRGDGVASHATKILMNSFYGVLATSACRFHSSALANAITQAGQWLLHWAKARMEARGYRVLYGDTDSLFVESGAASDNAAREAGALLARALNDDLRDHLRATQRLESHLELELEELYAKLVFPHVRGSTEGARKRYAGLVESSGRREIVFVGMESVRRDATEAAKELQRGLYERLFAELPVDEFVREFVRSVRAGERDAQLVYRKSLRKAASSYTATTPPHVKAARLEGIARGLVEYVVTVAGPEPVSSRGHALDHEHYVDKQLRPVAEPVLELLHVEWDDLLGRPRQLELF